MTDEFSFPPLHDLEAQELEERRAHLVREASRSEATSRSALFAVPGLRRVGRRRTLAYGLAVVIGASAIAGVALTREQSQPPLSGEQGPVGLVLPLALADSLAQPARPESVRRISLAGASAALGVGLPLPNTRLADAANVTTVWRATDGSAVVAVTFGRKLVVEYEYPSQYSLARRVQLILYRALAHEYPSSFAVAFLKGVPAVVLRPNSPEPGSLYPAGRNFGVVEWVDGTTRIAVIGHYGVAELKAVARSIISRAS